MRYLCLLTFAASLLPACDTTLEDALEEVRSATPSVCKDFCEEKILCEWPASEGDERDAAYSAEIKKCTVECSWYMADGVYVADRSAPMVEYLDHLDGDTFESLMDCVYYQASFRCAEQEEGGGDTFLFSPIVESKCVAAQNCLSNLGIDYSLIWVPLAEGGGECREDGVERMETSLF